jgi:hypothetical protein
MRGAIVLLWVLGLLLVGAFTFWVSGGAPIGASGTSIGYSITVTYEQPLVGATGEFLRLRVTGAEFRSDTHAELARLFEDLRVTSGLRSEAASSGEEGFEAVLQLTDEIDFEAALPSLTQFAVEAFDLRTGLRELVFEARHLAEDGQTELARRRLVWDGDGPRWE